MTTVDKFCDLALRLAAFNPSADVASVLAQAREALAIAGPQPRPKKAKPVRTRVEKTEAA